MKERKLFALRDLWLIGILLALAALLFAVRAAAPAGTVAVAETDSGELFRRDLSALSGPEEIRLKGKDGMALTVTLYPDGAQVTGADCPDLVCVRTGKLTGAGQTAVCIPAGIVLRLEGSNGPDAETY